jgi:hypothetical protein
MAESDPLSRMRDQIDSAYGAADRLVREAEAAARERAGDVPPSGWEGPRAERERSAFAELQALAGLLEAARTSVPPEVARQLGEAVRELLLALRALLDWWIERLERSPEPPVEVQDIPVE